jgi:hypothetical protein
MATIRRRTATVTLDDGGNGDTTISVRGAGSTDRWAGLYAIRVDTDDDVKAYLSVTVRPAEDIDEDNELTPGDPIAFISSPNDGAIYYPRDESVSSDGGALSGEENAIPFVSTESVFVEVDGGTPGNEVTVDLYFQTAGDQRF